MSLFFTKRALERDLGVGRHSRQPKHAARNYLPAFNSLLCVNKRSVRFRLRTNDVTRVADPLLMTSQASAWRYASRSHQHDALWSDVHCARWSCDEPRAAGDILEALDDLEHSNGFELSIVVSNI